MVSLDILSLVKTAQNQNGLRYSDYQRYRIYCTHKLRKLRVGAKFKFGRNRFENKAITSEDCGRDFRFLLMLLFNSERSWAYAMQLRQFLSEYGNKKAKYHLMSRLRKAVRWAEQLEQATAAISDTKTILEAQAYRASMAGNYSLEKRDFESALSNLLTAKAVYEKLQEVADSVQSVILAEKIETLATMIKYCQHQGLDAKDLLAMKMSDNPENQLLNAQIESLLAETQAKTLENVGNFTIQGKSYQVTNPKARLSLQRAEEAIIGLDTANDRFALYTEAFSHYDDALRIVKKDRDELRNQGEASAAEVINALFEAITQAKLSRTLDRNQEMAKAAEEKFESEVDQVLQGAKPKASRPQELVKLYDTILQNIEVLGEDMHESLKEEVKRKRTYYIAQVYVYSGKLLEAYALLQRCEQNDQVAVLAAKIHAKMILDNSLTPELSNLSIEDNSSLFGDFKYPPNVDLLLPKAVFYDLANDLVEYPDIKERFEEKKGFFSRWFGR